MNAKWLCVGALAPLLILAAPGCQCAAPVSSPGEPENVTDPSGGEDPRVGGEGEGDAGASTGICYDEDGDGLFAGPDCGNVVTDCDDTDSTVAGTAQRSCRTGAVVALDLGACRAGTQACSGGVWGSCEGEVGPSAEVCDGVDNDCNGLTDEGTSRTCYEGATGTAGTGVCRSGIQRCVDGAYGECRGQVVPTPESCDGQDNDCNYAVDDTLVRVTADGGVQQLAPIMKPVDVIFVIDNSGSMSDEIAAVENNINVNFAHLIGQSGLDYRVIMLSDYGSGLNQVCVKAPLGGSSCRRGCPTNTANFFHYPADIGSHDSLYRILETYDLPNGCNAPNGWSDWLRPQAAKVFVEITDDQPLVDSNSYPNTMTAASFRAGLFALSPAQFGDAASPNYIFHSIIGLAEKQPPEDPSTAWGPDAGMVTELCAGAVKTNGWEYQKLSIESGGLRYPICQLQSFDAVFREVAKGIIERARISCEFQLTSNGSVPGVEIVPPTGPSVPLTKVADLASCTGNAFYLDGYTIRLCPDACTLFSSQTNTTLELLSPCP